ncbi:MAG: hypothetical protein JJU29_09065 [Verrucomicrobia bacterium]|nr:hypothetical protein [Verrucomicrobiota bacterium]MCH8511802.1 hypothetical protein [Kiritimatiellia bacterium]
MVFRCVARRTCVWAFALSALSTLSAEEKVGHPRLIFTAAEVPSLRERAATPEGKAILARTREVLNEGFTTWSAAGHGFLYQVTGDPEEAARAREAVEKMLAGEANPDARYTFATAREHMRVGPVLSALALAYDFCHEAWDDAFRRQVLEGMLEHPQFVAITTEPQHHPGVNHWGPATGALAVALMGIAGDPLLRPGESEAVYNGLQLAITNANREFTEGFGPRGSYGEGHYTGRISANTGILPFMVAMRNAQGIDLTAYYPNSIWLSGRWIYELTRFENGEVRNNQRGMYARDPFTRGEMLSSDGDFVFGFAVLPPDLRRALLWTYVHVVQPDPATRDYDILEYPHFGAYALKYWPIGETPLNPGEVLPSILHDPSVNAILWRNGWHENPGQDIVVSAMLGAEPNWGRGLSVNGSVWILAENQRYEFPGAFHISTPSALELKPEQRRGRVVARPNPDFGLGSRPQSWVDWIADEDTTLIVDLDDTLEDGLRGLVAMRGPMAGLVSTDARGTTTWGGSELGWGNLLSIHDPGATEPLDPANLLEPGVTRLPAPDGLHTWAVHHPRGVVYLCVIGGNPRAPVPDEDGISIGNRRLVLRDTTLTLEHTTP